MLEENAILASTVKAPDENAVHVFQQRVDADKIKFYAHIFALLRAFSQPITQQIKLVGDEPRYERC